MCHGYESWGLSFPQKLNRGTANSEQKIIMKKFFVIAAFLTAIVGSEANTTAIKFDDPPTGGVVCGTDANGRCVCCQTKCSSGYCCWAC